MPDDMLTAMKLMQQVFDGRVQRGDFDKWPQQHQLYALATAIKAESIELQEALGFLPDGLKKWWKLTFDADHALEESIDILHFLLSFWNHLGVSSFEIYEKYTEKMKINHQRQDEGY